MRYRRDENCASCRRAGRQSLPPPRHQCSRMPSIRREDDRIVLVAVQVVVAIVQIQAGAQLMKRDAEIKIPVLRAGYGDAWRDEDVPAAVSLREVLVQAPSTTSRYRKPGVQSTCALSPTRREAETRHAGRESLRDRSFGRLTRNQGVRRCKLDRRRVGGEPVTLRRDAWPSEPASVQAETLGETCRTAFFNRSLYPDVCSRPLPARAASSVLVSTLDPRVRLEPEIEACRRCRRLQAVRVVVEGR